MGKKLNENTNMFWFSKFAKEYESFGFAIDTDSHNNSIAVANLFNGKTYRSSVLKYNEKGKIMWAKEYCAEEQDMAYDVSVDSNDNIIVAGFEGSWTNDPLPNGSAYILKYNENGVLLWKKTFKKGICTMGFGVKNDSKDNIYLLSTYFKNGEPNLACLIIKYDKTGKKIWDQTYHEHYMDIPYSLTIDSEDNVIIVGYSFTPFKFKGSFTGGFLSLKYDGQGKKLWHKRHLSFENSEALDVAVDSHDNIVLIGNNDQDLIVIKISKIGNALWERRYRTKYAHVPYGVVINSKDEIIVGGNSFSSGKPKTIFLVKYDSNGKLESIKKSEINGIIFDISIDLSGSIISVGESIGIKNEFYISKEEI